MRLPDPMKRKIQAWLRRFKWVYYLNNLQHYKQLKKNKKVYRNLGIKQPVWGNLQQKHLVHLPEIKTGCDNITYSNELLKNNDEKLLSNEQIEFFIANGYLILKNFFSELQADEIANEVDRLIDEKTVHFNFTNRKIAFAFKKSALLKQVTLNETLINIGSMLLGGNIFPYHTLNFLQGSEQKPHSDAVHMSTYPQGGLIAAWIALEPTDEENGPLVYYPGSHNLPYLHNADLDLKENVLLMDSNPNAAYETKMAALLQKHQLKEHTFKAQKGDVLIWHGNLVHGGKPMLNKKRTRKSMVIHYLREESLCWHELSQRPAIIEPIT